MNLPFFISKRLILTKESNNRFTKPIIRLGILSISLSVAVMLISIIVVKGFKEQIKEKLIGFGSHIQVTHFDNQSYESIPFEFNKDSFTFNISESYKITSNQIKNIQSYALKAGVIKTSDEIYGTVLKGMDSDFDTSYFSNTLLEGKMPIFNDTIISNDVIISKVIADFLNFKINDNIFIYFIQDPPRIRKFNIIGIYETSLIDIDELYIICDINHIRKLNGWKKSQSGNNYVGGIEISINNLNNLDFLTKHIHINARENTVAKNIKELYPQIFDWLSLQDLNVKIILFLMLLVGVINMVTSLLIIIFEKTNFIGILKALGSSNLLIRKIFIYNSLYLIGNGLFLGNLIGLGLAFLQLKLNFISLDPNIYFMKEVPILFDFFDIFILNLSTIIICLSILIIPTFIISKINPIKSIRFS